MDEITMYFKNNHTEQETQVTSPFDGTIEEYFDLCMMFGLTLGFSEEILMRHMDNPVAIGRKYGR